MAKARAPDKPDKAKMYANKMAKMRLEMTKMRPIFLRHKVRTFWHRKV